MQSCHMICCSPNQNIDVYKDSEHSSRPLAPLDTPVWAFKGSFWVYAISTVLVHIYSVWDAMWGIGVCERTGDDLNLGRLVLVVVWIVSTDEATPYPRPDLHQ